MDERVAAVVAAVLASAKYRYVTPDLVRDIGARELAARDSVKAAVKATKNKLHQVGGAYFTARPNYPRAVDHLRRATGSPAAWRDACREVMQLHASTAERLPILAEFYAATLAGLPPLRTVMDVACGLNPLARPWMPLPADVTYLAYDMYADLVDFLNQVMPLAGLAGRAAVRDVVGQPPTLPVDLALLLKLLPVLDQVDGTAVPRLLDAVTARYLLISFPVHSLGGRRKGMAAHYESQFAAWSQGRGWSVRRFAFATELAFLVTTPGAE